jgi:hypothetical protein
VAALLVALLMGCAAGEPDPLATYLSALEQTRDERTQVTAIVSEANSWLNAGPGQTTPPPVARIDADLHALQKAIADDIGSMVPGDPELKRIHRLLAVAERKLQDGIVDTRVHLTPDADYEAFRSAMSPLQLGVAAADTLYGAWLDEMRRYCEARGRTCDLPVSTRLVP